MSILPTTVDTHAKQASPSANFGTAPRLLLQGSGSSAQKQAYIFFPRPFPAGATITLATLRVYRKGAWSGSKTVTAKRIIEKWGEGTLTWNNAPTVSATHSVAVSAGAGADESVIEFDVKTMLQDAASGGKFIGFRLELTQDAEVALRSSEDPNTDLRPTLELEWSEAPETPDRLSPDGGQAFADEFPILSWHFADKSGNTVQASSQIQTAATDAGWDATTGFPTPDYDTGKVANEEQQYDLDDGAFLGVDPGETVFWTVKVWDGTDFASDFSPPAEFIRTGLGTLGIDSPGATTGETTPPIEWTLTGATQESYRVILYRVKDNGDLVELWRTHATSLDDSVTPDAGLIKTGHTYRVTVEVWDDVDRVGDVHLQAEQDFTYVRDGTPDPVDTLTAAAYAPDGVVTPAVELTWTRADAPDFWCLVVDGEETYDRIELVDTHVSGDTYSLIYWGATPRASHTYEIEAVVQSAPGEPFKHSDANPTDTATASPAGIWLSDDSIPAADPGDFVMLAGQDSADVSIGESGTTYDLIGARSPVRIVDVIRGYEGSVTGILLGTEDRDTFLRLKGLDGHVRLILGDLSIPVRLEEAHATPTPTPGDYEFVAGFNFFQTGEPWPVELP